MNELLQGEIFIEMSYFLLKGFLGFSSHGVIWLGLNNQGFNEHEQTPTIRFCS